VEKPPPHAQPFVTSSSGQPVLDQYGNFQGGVRTPYVDEPVSTRVAQGTNCFIWGYQIPLSESTLQALYGNHDTYLREVTTETNDLVREHWITDDDAAQLIDQASNSSVPAPLVRRFLRTFLRRTGRDSFRCLRLHPPLEEKEISGAKVAVAWNSRRSSDRPTCGYFRTTARAYALTIPGRFYRSKDGLHGFEPGPVLFNPNMRHSAVLNRGNELSVFWSQVGEAPERILLSRTDLTGARRFGAEKSLARL
jgi:hypothetical protein